MNSIEHTPANGPYVLTDLGKIIGYKERGMLRFSGIPYAKAKRFEMPIAVTELPSPFLADKPSPASPQSPDMTFAKIFGQNGIDPIGLSEDCLRLSISLPENLENNEPLPVMVWIHGGGYTGGAGDDSISDPRKLIASQEVMIVKITYRVGFLGFLGGYMDRPANLGLFDILSALSWIQEHISSFGGDPDQVTLFGQSAGGDLITHLMISQGHEGLFQRVIIQSPPLGLRFNKSQITKHLQKFGQEITNETSIDQLLEIQSRALTSISFKEFGINAGMPFGVQYGYAPLPAEQDLERSYKECAKDIDVIIGYTHEETSMFTMSLPFYRSLKKLPFGRFILRNITQLTTCKSYRKPVSDFANAYRSYGGNLLLYTIDFRYERTPFGATHCIDLPMLFGDQEDWANATLFEGIPWKEFNHKSRPLRDLWGSFAHSSVAFDAYPKVIHFVI